MTDNLTIAGEFQLPTYDDWVKEVEKVLKGAPFDKKMLHKTYEGMTVRPIYTRQDWSGDGDPSGFPGAMPFTRGSGASGTSQLGWGICQAHGHPDLAENNRNIHVDLQRGVTSLLLHPDAASRAGKDGHQAGDLAGADGAMVYSVDDLDRLLRDVILNAAPIALAPGAQGVAFAALLAALWRRRGIADSAATGAFNADPLGALAATGTLPVPIDKALSQVAELAVHTARTYPNVTALPRRRRQRDPGSRLCTGHRRGVSARAHRRRHGRRRRRRPDRRYLAGRLPVLPRHRKAARRP